MKITLERPFAQALSARFPRLSMSRISCVREQHRFAALEGLLTPGKYAVDQLSIDDAALFYVELWADRVGLEHA